ncbi:hypothetical protein [Neobacillus niacini]|uniref:hypothetical protein n=1 Tax=Neobacillus niacini TaxID=86668 RepID=UPI0027D83B2F|nr:hypothetical protein [Neobacillus niacini]
MVIMPIFSLPIEMGPYPQAVETLLMAKKRRMGSHFFYNLTTLISYLLAAFISMAAIVMTKSTLSKAIRSFKKEYQIQINIKALIRGFCLVIIWTPVAAMSLSALESVKGSWITYFVPALFLSLLLLVIDIIIGFWEIPLTYANNKKVIKTENPIQTKKYLYANLFELIFIFIIFIISSNFFAHLVNVSLIHALCVMSIIITIVWAIRIREIKSIAYKIKYTFLIDISNKDDQFSLFLSLGLFLYSFEHSIFLELFNNIISIIFPYLGVGLIFIIGFIPILLCQIGVFPILSVILLAGTIDPESIKLKAEWFALLITAGGGTAFMFSQLSATNQFIAQLLEVSSLKVAKSNKKFALVLWFVSCLYVIFLQHFFS